MTFSPRQCRRPDTLPRSPRDRRQHRGVGRVCASRVREGISLLDWAAPYQEMMGPFGTVYAQCLRGMAARNRLDIVAALQNFRTAFEVRHGSGGPTRTQRGLRSSLLAELLYETGDLAGAQIVSWTELSAEFRGVQCTWPPGT